MEKYFKDVVEETIAWPKMIPMQWTLDYFATPPTAAEMRHKLNELLRDRWDPKWQKSPKKSTVRKKRILPSQVATLQDTDYYMVTPVQNLVS